MSVTMADVARAAGASIATVGRVIHQNGYVSKEVRAKIEAVIAELGYVPNESARTLKSRRSGIIGCLVLQSDNSLYYRINDAVIDAAAHSGLSCITMEAQSKARNEQQIIQKFIGMRVDGLVIISNPFITPDMFAALRQAETPVVAIERGYAELGIDSLTVRDAEAVCNAAGGMLKAGHQRIGLIAAQTKHAVEQRRLAGYEEALQMAGISPDPALIRLMPDYSVQNGRAAAEALFSLSKPPTAILCTADSLAAGVLQAAYARGLRVPEDLSLAGYDDVLSRALSPALDSVGLVLDGIGDMALDMLQKRREHPEAPADERWIHTVYAKRGTVCALRKE